MSTKKAIEKLEELDRRLDSIEIILVKQEQNLNLHMKRSETLEALLNHVRENEIKPLNTFKDKLEGGLKLIGVIAVVTTICIGLIDIFKQIL